MSLALTLFSLLPLSSRQPTMRSVPALALAALAALASTAAALPPLPKPPVPGNPACLAHIATLRNGACSPIAKKVTKETALAITGATCAQLEALDITADVSGRGVMDVTVGTGAVCGRGGRRAGGRARGAAHWL